jgi:stress-induced morphogen
MNVNLSAEELRTLSAALEGMIEEFGGVHKGSEKSDRELLEKIKNHTPYKSTKKTDKNEGTKMNYKDEILLRSGIKSYWDVLKEEKKEHFECKMCGNTFTDQEKYKKHEHKCALKEEEELDEMGKEDDYYECNVCGKKFKDKKKYKKHQHNCGMKY